MKNSISHDYSTTMTDFSFSLFQELSTHNEGNVFVSTFSVNLLLMLLTIGSRGKTNDQLKSVLKTSGNNALNGCDGYTDSVLENINTPDLLTVANGIFADKTCDLNANYVNRAREHFNSEVRRLDFASDPSTVEEEINEWTRSKTNGKIGQLFNSGDVKRDTKLLLASAVYFRNAWKKTFTNTDTAKFCVSGKNYIDVEMMHATNYYKYYKNDQHKFAAIELPYKNGGYEMVVVLPDRINGLNDLERVFLGDPGMFRGTVANMTLHKVYLDVPKFKFESEFSFKETLENLGSTDMFTREADFSGITSGSDERLIVDDIKHKTFIDVDQEGTEAAGVVGGRIVTYMMDFVPANLNTVHFSANHPFLFVVKRGQDVVFMGRLANPNV